VGNLDAQRDFLAVDDVVGAYCLALEKIFTLPAGLVLNICSGVPRKIEELLAGFLRLSTCTVAVEKDPARMRPSDIPLAVGNAEAARHYLGWQPQVSFDRILDEILNEWRQKIDVVP
jgi:GDP-4-dehydro-6-deoxy-D-mannose reductase